MSIVRIRSTFWRRVVLVLLIPIAIPLQILVSGIAGVDEGLHDLWSGIVDVWKGGERFPDDLTRPN